jgi:integrase
MGLYKICEHTGRTRDRCEHAWWGSFRGIRVSLPKWANREIHTKAEAQAVLDEVRTAIRAGTFDPRGRAPQEVSPMTLREFADIYKERHAVAKKLSLARTIDWRIRPILERFGGWALTEIKTAHIEDFIADLRKPRIVGKRAEERCLTAASINRTIELLRHMLNWAVGREYLEKTPFRRGTETLIKKLREDNQRRRRLSTDEELRLLAAAPAHLRSMIITALDTGTRRGEMLALRFADIDSTRGLIVLRGETTKSKKTRLVPISTQRLRAVLEWLRIDAEGKQKSDETLVFSNEVGEPLPHFHDAWLRTVLKAHDIKPRWTARLKYKGLSSESKNAFRKINLRWHDLRHEYASRLVERGVPLAQVRDLLGHASVTTTERYDNQKLENLQIASAKLESGLTFEPPARETVGDAAFGAREASTIRLKPEATRSEEETARSRRRERTPVRRSQIDRAPGEGAKFQESFKYEGAEDRSLTVREVPAIEPNELEDLNLRDWLGGRDSNPDNVVQSHVSYR